MKTSTLAIWIGIMVVCGGCSVYMAHYLQANDQTTHSLRTE